LAVEELLMQTHAPESVGIDSRRLERIDTYIQDAVQNDRLPGIMTLVQRRGKVVQVGKYGKMDIEAGRAMEEDALFRIYSMTKPVTSVAAMMLFEEGRLNVTDPVSKYIPAFKKTKVYDGMGVLGMKLVEQQPEMTIHHLLTHMAGLSYGWFFDSPVEELYRQGFPSVFHREQPLKDVIEKLAEIPLLFQPGTQWRYSVATDVLGYVVQVVADMPLADFFQERIFKPLGMMDTDFYVPAEKCGRLAQVYTSAKLYDPIPIPPEDVGLIRDVTLPTHCPSGGGGLISTLADYLSFCECLLHGGKYEGGRLLSRKTIEWMTANHIPDALMPMKAGLDTIDHGFGLGFRVTTSLGMKRRLSSVGEYGWGGAAKTYFLIDPAEALVLVMMTQHMPVEIYPMQEMFTNLAYQAIDD
jgi:CubicO group peptidase (beta-lactamase class C family)